MWQSWLMQSSAVTLNVLKILYGQSTPVEQAITAAAKPLLSACPSRAEQRYLATLPLKEVEGVLLEVRFQAVDSYAMSRAHYALLDLPGADLLGFGRRVLASSSVNGRRTAPDVFEKCGTCEAVQALIQIMQHDTDLDMVTQSISALGRIGDRSVIPLLQQIYNGGDKTVDSMGFSKADSARLALLEFEHWRPDLNLGREGQ